MLTMIVRGVQFQGNDFDGFEPKGAPDSAQLSYTLLRGCLCFCTIEADIPIQVVTPPGVVEGLLTFELCLKGPLLVTNQMDPTRLTLRLAVNGQNFCSHGKTGWFEGRCWTFKVNCRMEP